MHIQSPPGWQAQTTGNKSLSVTRFHTAVYGFNFVPSISQYQCSSDLGTVTNTQIKIIVPGTFLPLEGKKKKHSQEDVT